MNDIRLIALDMDGTLLDSDHTTVPPRNLAALQAADELGVKIAIATGRSWSLAIEAVAKIPQVSYAITGNGGCVVDARTGEVLVKYPMDIPQSVRIVRMLREMGLAFEIYIDGQNYVEESSMDLDSFSLSPEFGKMYMRHVHVVPDILDVIAQTGPEKFDIFYLPEEEWQPTAKRLLTTGPMAVTGGLPTNIEMTCEGVHKGAALAALAAKLGLRQDQVMAFGDSDNDKEMLAWALHSFAMENGSDVVKAAARHIAPPNYAGGVGAMIEQYVLEG